MRALWLFTILTFISFLAPKAMAQTSSQSSLNNDLIKSLSFVFAGSYLKDPSPLGVNFHIEAQGAYLKTQDYDNSLDSELWFSTISVKKGIYWNLHLNLSFLSPVNDSFQNGFSAGVGHTLNFKSMYLSSNVYAFSYNVSENINQKGAGLSSLLYFKTHSFYTGFGFGGENITSEQQETETISRISKKIFTYRALISMLFTRGSHRFSLDASYLDEKNYSTSFSYGLRL